jgi:hypothetical protein
MPLAAFCLRHFSADFIICTCEFEFRQAHQVIELNRVALAVLRCEKELVIVPGATHLFEEPGTLDKVASLAREWFQHHLISEGPRMARARR